MLHSVRGLRTVSRLETGDEVKGAAVIAPMTCATQWDDAQWVVAAAEAARHHVGGIDPRIAVAGQTAAPRDLRALCV